MGLFKRSKRKIFNVVIEGTYHDDWRNLHFKIAQLQVPEGTTILNDGAYRYKLHGRSKDFSTIQRTNGEVGGLEVRIDSLGFCEGVVLPYKGGIPDILERPRSVCTRDGRVFVDEDMATDENYLKTVPLTVKTAGEIFGDKRFAEMYRKL